MKNKKKTWQCVKTLYPFCSHQNSWDLWMFIPLKMVCIGIDPYPHKTHQTHRYLVGPSPGHRHRGALGSKPCTEDTLAVTLSTAKMTSMKASVNTTRKSGVTFCGFFPSKKKPEIFPMVTWPVDFSHRKCPICFSKNPHQNSGKNMKKRTFFVIVCYPRDDDLWCSMIFPGNIQIWHIWMLIWLCSTFSDCLWGKTSIIGSGKRVKTCGGARKLINKLSYGSVLKYCSLSRNVTNMSMKPTLETGTMMCFLQIAAVLVVWPEFMSHHNISGVPQSFKFPKSSQYTTLNG